MIVTETEYRVPELSEFSMGFTYEKLTSESGWTEITQPTEPSETEKELFATLISLDRIRVSYQVTKEVEPEKPGLFTRLLTWIKESPFIATYVTPIVATVAPLVLLILGFAGILFINLLHIGAPNQRILQYVLYALVTLTLCKIGDRLIRYAFERFSVLPGSVSSKDYTVVLLVIAGVYYLVTNLVK